MNDTNLGVHSIVYSRVTSLSTHTLKCMLYNTDIGGVVGDNEVVLRVIKALYKSDSVDKLKVVQNQD